jgi:hypothetical protein
MANEEIRVVGPQGGREKKKEEGETRKEKGGRGENSGVLYARLTRDVTLAYHFP